MSKTREYRIPRPIQAMANVMIADKHLMITVHERVAKYITLYTEGTNDAERSASRERVRHTLRSVSEVWKEEQRLRKLTLL